MNKQGMVIGVEGDDVVVRANRESSCGSCAGKSACGTLGSWDLKKKDKNQYDIQLPNTLNARVGDMVMIAVPDQLILTASMMFYGLPVLAFITCGAISFTFAEYFGLAADMFSAIGGLMGAGLTWTVLMKRTGSMEMPEITEVYRSL